MSDFLCSSISQPRGKLTKFLHEIYHDDVPEVYEYHGPWGSLAVSRNLYNGFQPLETDSHIFVVIGGPVLYFRDNSFLTGNNSTAGTNEIYLRWLAGTIRWDEDLSGPFAVLVVDKVKKKIRCIVDMMMFIPVYRYTQDGSVVLGTHIDACAAAAGQSRQLDLVSMVDFVLNHVVTFPYTIYKRIYQCHPAAEHKFEMHGKNMRESDKKIYWVPDEISKFFNIKQAAKSLRKGLHHYVERITESMDEVAQFISAGEDSRVIMGMLPQNIDRHAFVFVESMNREGRIAEKVSSVYGAKFQAERRGPNHYLDILPEATALIGSNHQYVHAHSLRFHKICELDRYSAVFGGYLSDSLLKAQYARKMRGLHRFPFLPLFSIPGETRTKPIENKLFSQEMLDGVNQRRNDHLERIMSFRKVTAHEWFGLWPATMRIAMPNLYSNRRLFRTYEAYMCNEAVKISASVPTGWKLNRRLFQKAARPFLKPCRWVISGDGRFPYLPWWVNVPIQFYFWVTWGVAALSGRMSFQGAWGDWQRVMKSASWNEAISRYSKGFEMLRQATNSDNTDSFFEGNNLKIEQKLNFMQLLYILSR